MRCPQTYGVELQGGNSNIASLCISTLMFNEKMFENAKEEMVAIERNLPGVTYERKYPAHWAGYLSIHISTNDDQRAT